MFIRVNLKKGSRRGLKQFKQRSTNADQALEPIKKRKRKKCNGKQIAQYEMLDHMIILERNVAVLKLESTKKPPRTYIAT